MSDKDNDPSVKPSKLPLNADQKDQNRNSSTNSEGDKSKSNGKLPMSSPDCIFDWSPHKDFNDYMRKLNFWVWECQQWKLFHSQYPTLASQPAGSQVPFPFATLNGNLNPGQTQSQTTRPNANSGTVYAIPRVWKRIAAEVIDCILLLLLKITLLSMVLTEFVQFQNLEDIKALLMEDADNMKTFNLIMYEHSAEMLAIAIIHRIIVCVYETYSLYAYPNPNVGGATLGKMIMGLKVVSCLSVDDLGNGRVRVWPAGNIGFTNSLVRAVIKNSSIVFFIPACFTILGSQYNRTAYDFMCSCIVVENVPSEDNRNNNNN